MKIKGSSIQQLERDKPKSRCRKWRLWVSTDDGRKSRRFNGTWTEACDALQAFLDELIQHVSNSDSFASYAASWRLWRANSGNFSPNTVACEKMCVRNLLRTELSTMRMDEIAPQDCRDALIWLRTHPKRGGVYSPTTMAKLHQVLHAIFSEAADDGKIAKNPMDNVKRPSVRVAEREALTPDELQLFLNRVDELPMDGRVMAVYLMACLGLRCGEACALLDAEVDGWFASVTSTVRAADRSVGKPKSAAGVRKLPMPPRLIRKVEDWREIRNALGLHDAPNLCCRLDGSRMAPANVENWWRETARGKLGCDGMTLHQLRHSNLSMMARHMSVFDLQRYAGWSSIAPAKIYVHNDVDSVSRAVAEAWQGGARVVHAIR